MREQIGISERRACAVVGQARATERYAPRESPDEAALTARLIALATRFGRYGYRRITALLHREGWRVNDKRGCAPSIRTTSGRTTSCMTSNIRLVL